MSDRIRIADLRAKTIVGPSEWSITRFAPFVELTPDERDALVEAVIAARLVAKNPAARALTWYPRLRSALARFDFEAEA